MFGSLAARGILVAALMLTAVGGPSAAAPSSEGPPAETAARKSCGIYASTSGYRRARIIAIRGVGCTEARRVAIRYDRTGRAPRPWRCFLAHHDRPRVFSCGHPPRRGDVRRWRYALEVVGVR